VVLATCLVTLSVVCQREARPVRARRRGTPAPGRWFSAVGPRMGINGTANEYSLTESFNRLCGKGLVSVVLGAIGEVEIERKAR
jgi:hypothetical protein